jgi:hypothetical protein
MCVKHARLRLGPNQQLELHTILSDLIRTNYTQQRSSLQLQRNALLQVMTVKRMWTLL